MDYSTLDLDRRTEQHVCSPESPLRNVPKISGHRPRSGIHIRTLHRLNVETVLVLRVSWSSQKHACFQKAGLKSELANTWGRIVCCYTWLRTGIMVSRNHTSALLRDSYRKYLFIWLRSAYITIMFAKEQRSSKISKWWRKKNKRCSLANTLAHIVN